MVSLSFSVLYVSGIPPIRLCILTHSRCILHCLVTVIHIWITLETYAWVYQLAFSYVAGKMLSENSVLGCVPQKQNPRGGFLSKHRSNGPCMWNLWGWKAFWVQSLFVFFSRFWNIYTGFASWAFLIQKPSTLWISKCLSLILTSVKLNLIMFCDLSWGDTQKSPCSFLIEHQQST